MFSHKLFGGICVFGVFAVSACAGMMLGSQERFNTEVDSDFLSMIAKESKNGVTFPFLANTLLCSTKQVVQGTSYRIYYSKNVTTPTGTEREVDCLDKIWYRSWLEEEKRVMITTLCDTSIVAQGLENCNALPISS